MINRVYSETSATHAVTEYMEATKQTTMPPRHYEALVRIFAQHIDAGIKVERSAVLEIIRNVSQDPDFTYRADPLKANGAAIMATEIKKRIIDR